MFRYFAKVPLLVLCQHQTFQMSALPSDATVLPFDALLRASKGLREPLRVSEADSEEEALKAGKAFLVRFR